MEADLSSTQKLGPNLGPRKKDALRLCGLVWLPAAKICKDWRVSDSDPDRWYEGKLLKKTVFQ